MPCVFFVLRDYDLKGAMLIVERRFAELASEVLLMHWILQVLRTFRMTNQACHLEYFNLSSSAR